MKILNRFIAAILVAAVSFAGTQFAISAYTGTNLTQAQLFDSFPDAGPPVPIAQSLRNLVASVVTLQDTQTITGAKTFSSAITASGGISGTTTTSNLVATGGSITGVSGISYVWLRYSAAPIFIASTGTMANNGAITLGTALATTYANAFVTLPAGAIAAGVPAATDTYFVQMSSTTVGTVCNNRLADNLDANGLPVIPASCTAFSTTGPGAYGGVTGAVTLLTLSLPAATLTATSGSLDADILFSYTNNANAKTTTITFGGSNWVSGNVTSVAMTRFVGRITNRSASVQSVQGSGFTSNNSILLSAGTYLAINTASAVAITIALTHATATDNAAVESIDFRVTK